MPLRAPVLGVADRRSLGALLAPAADAGQAGNKQLVVQLVLHIGPEDTGHFSLLCDVRTTRHRYVASMPEQAELL